MRRRTAGIGPVLMLISGLALAQGYPAKPIRLVVPFAPGGTSDIVARIVAEPLGKLLGQSVVVDNKTGAGGSIGMTEVARAPGDGYALGLATVSTHAVNPATQPRPGYNPEADFQPITVLATSPNVMAAHPSVPAATHAQFKAYLLAHPGKLAYASPGNGSLGHMLGALYTHATGTSMLHVPYRGAGPAKNDVVAGQVQLLFDNLPSALPLIQSGQLRAIAVASPKRVESLPEVPTFAELDLPANNDPAWFGLVAPASTPPAVVTALHRAVTAVLAQPEVRERLRAQGMAGVGNSPAQFKAQISTELARMRQVAKAARIEAD